LIGIAVSQSGDFAGEQYSGMVKHNIFDTPLLVNKANEAS
jgi:hypothetical protein